MAKVVRKVAAAPGGEIVSAVGLELDFSESRGRGSVYRRLLEQLAAAQGSVLKLTNAKARYSVTKAARKLKLKVLYACKGDDLYCKIASEAAGEKQAPVPALVSHAIDPVLFKALKEGPCTAKE